jgi:putative membrane protein
VLSYAKTDWLHMLVSPRGSFAPGLMRRVLVFGLIATALWIAHRFNDRVVLNIGLYEISGAVIALILAFRTNTSYNRFWEGRTLWGSIVNASRNLGRVARCHAAIDVGEAREFVTWVVVFAHAARRSLREEPERPEIDKLLPEAERAAMAAHPSPPLYASEKISSLLAGYARRGALDAPMVARVEEEVMVLVNSLGGCERIRKTPTPLGYVLLLRRMVALYIATLPLSLVEEVGFLTPLVTMMVAYAVLMIEGIGQELDNPFGHDPNDLALSRVCDTIERDLLGSSSLDLVLASTARFPDED